MRWANSSVLVIVLSSFPFLAGGRYSDYISAGCAAAAFPLRPRQQCPPAPARPERSGRKSCAHRKAERRPRRFSPCRFRQKFECSAWCYLLVSS
nr:MAG TPA: hypothetical protein [Caudoviricetes sp.]